MCNAASLADTHKTLMLRPCLLPAQQGPSKLRQSAAIGPRPAEGQREDDKTLDRGGLQTQLQELVDIEVPCDALGVGGL